jgi:DNA repair exonuclease SbcCD ATPase subunit
MRWTKLIVKNFLSFKEFTLDLDNRGLVLIEGKNLTNEKFKSNGSGKTGLLEGVIYALYGATSKGLKTDEVINDEVGKNTSVILEGYKGEDLYRIERYRKHSKHKNKVKLFINGDEKTDNSTGVATQALIQKAVGLDQTTFTNSIMFSQGAGAGRFAIATDKEKKEILENLVNLSIYGRAQEIASKRVKDKKAEIENKKREGERLQWELSQVDALEEQDRERYQSTHQMIQQENQKVKNLEEQLNQYITQNKEHIEAVEASIGGYRLEQDKLVSPDIGAYEQEVHRVQRKLQDNQRQVQQQEFQKNELLKDYKKLKDNTHCPICGNELDITHRDQEMLSIREQLKPILMELSRLDTEQQGIHAELGDAQEQYGAMKQSADKVMEQFREYNQRINTAEKAIQEYNDYIMSYKNAISQANSTLEKLQQVSAPQPRDAEREAVCTKIKTHREELLQLEQELTKIENVVKIYSNSGVKSHVLDLVTPFLNKQANKYLTTLSGADMEVTFSTQTQNKNGEMAEKFDVKLTNAAGGKSYKANSEGEKKRADISIALALQDLVMQRPESQSNIVVYDEVFDALDSVGSENVITLLKERLDTVGTILVITHNEHLKSMFDKVITVTKNKDKISTVYESEGIT